MSVSLSHWQIWISLQDPLPFFIYFPEKCAILTRGIFLKVKCPISEKSLNPKNRDFFTKIELNQTPLNFTNSKGKEGQTRCSIFWGLWVRPLCKAFMHISNVVVTFCQMSAEKGIVTAAAFFFFFFLRERETCDWKFSGVDYSGSKEVLKRCKEIWNLIPGWGESSVVLLSKSSGFAHLALEWNSWSATFNVPTLNFSGVTMVACEHWDQNLLLWDKIALHHPKNLHANRPFVAYLLLQHNDGRAVHPLFLFSWLTAALWFLHLVCVD